MQRFQFPILHYISMGLLIASLSMGCAALEPKTDPPDVMLQDAQAMIKAENYSDAISKINNLLQEYPESKERVTAMILLGDTHYSLEEYAEAKFHFQRFIELFPAHPQAGHAMYFLALCDYMQMDVATRDQTYAQEALKSFDRLLKEHPNTKYAERGRIKRAECLRSIAQNQMEIGKFYFRTSSYQAAINRLKNLIVTYPDQGFTAEAIFLLGESYYNEENFETARDYYRQLVKTYPRSPFVREARARLRQIP